MPSYDYLAIDSAGREKRGALSAASEEALRDQLRARALLPVRISAGSGNAPSAAKALPTAKAGGALFAKKLKVKELTLFTRQLATLVSVSPLEESLRAIGAQAERPHIAAIVANVHAAVVEGQRLGAALGREPKSFPPLYRAMVSAGEGSGAMTQILNRLADLMERQAEVRGKIVTALVYPIMLALVALLIITGLMTFVVPKVVDQFDTMGQALPLLTRIVIGVSDFMTSWGLVVLAALAAAALVFARMLANEGFRLKFDSWLLRLPFFGRLIRDLNAARLARTLSTVIANGMPLLDGLSITARTVGNRRLRAATLAIVESVNEGGSLSGAMRRSDAFPPLLVHMTASGEQSGQLETMLARAADYMEREFDAFTSGALSLLEPAIIVLMGGLVAIIVLSILLPIMQLNTLAIS
ncbi:type II secretion system inner membrane protein GspF [Pacificimonas flava]|uniref:General secretion pathway protein F n=1 Tax=Pacificimonas flava TaxID=1234595 RepID=M2SCJ8_9SPHN|nr:type II secretion system inner membrane protein GspF [Pacificimonas flava]EMD83100.1 General secretion pathway protein F [Pacificimonas flava]MBB5280258.1 general secretion pathway protein F [Pacificimonas flava]